MEWLEVKNWQKYQHYKDRRPPWIKLHVSVLNDSKFSMLSCASKGLLMQLWILASESDGKVPYDLNELQFRLRDKTIKNSDLNILISQGFFKNCKHVQASAVPETETETETETEKHTSCPHKKIVELYHEILPELSGVLTWNERRKALLQNRWNEDKVCQSLDWWKGYFGHVRNSKFLMGNSKLMPGRDKVFQADLEWLIRPSNFIKVREGKYH